MAVNDAVSHLKSVRDPVVDEQRSAFIICTVYKSCKVIVIIGALNDRIINTVYQLALLP